MGWLQNGRLLSSTRMRTLLPRQAAFDPIAVVDAILALFRKADVRNPVVLGAASSYASKSCRSTMAFPQYESTAGEVSSSSTHAYLSMPNPSPRSLSPPERR